MDDQHDVEEATDIDGKQVAATLRGFGHGWQGQQNTTHSVAIRQPSSSSHGLGSGGPDAAHAQAGWLVCGESATDDELLPVGIDSHRYRAIGNGVASPVAEWVGRRLAGWFRA